LQASLGSRECLVCQGTLALQAGKGILVPLGLMERMGWMELQACQGLLGTEARLGRMEVPEFRGSQDLLGVRAPLGHQASPATKVCLENKEMWVLLGQRVQGDIEDPQDPLEIQGSQDLWEQRGPWERPAILELRENRGILELEGLGDQGELLGSLEAVGHKVSLAWKESQVPLVLQAHLDLLGTPLPSLPWL